MSGTVHTKTHSSDPRPRFPLHLSSAPTPSAVSASRTAQELEVAGIIDSMKHGGDVLPFPTPHPVWCEYIDARKVRSLFLPRQTITLEVVSAEPCDARYRSLSSRHSTVHPRQIQTGSNQGDPHRQSHSQISVHLHILFPHPRRSPLADLPAFLPSQTSDPP